MQIRSSPLQCFADGQIGLLISMEHYQKIWSAEGYAFNTNHLVIYRPDKINIM